MDNPFTADSQNPFQTPYQAGGAQPNSGISVKPFTARDLATKVGDGQNGVAMPKAALSPFLPAKPGSAFLEREAPSTQPQSVPTPNFQQDSPLATAPQDDPFNTFAIMAPAVGSPVDFSPAPLESSRPVTATSISEPYVSPQHRARQSQIVALADMDATYQREFFMTTTSTVDGFTIDKYLGMVSVEIVLPKDLLFRNPAPYGELNRLKSAEDHLQQVKNTALDELSGRARLLGADAVVGVSLQFSQFDAIVCLCSVVGTAVRLKA